MGKYESRERFIGKVGKGIIDISTHLILLN
ncbi:hypothetical protein C5S53_00585 [Methanophagales archaeon]|nr:hypothetical protein C5S53_00585 [Methanophagales archaeon]